MSIETRSFLSLFQIHPHWIFFCFPMKQSPFNPPNPPSSLHLCLPLPILQYTSFRSKSTTTDSHPPLDWPQQSPPLLDPFHSQCQLSQTPLSHLKTNRLEPTTADSSIGSFSIPKLVTTNSTEPPPHWPLQSRPLSLNSPFHPSNRPSPDWLPQGPPLLIILLDPFHSLSRPLQTPQDWLP